MKIEKFTFLIVLGLLLNVGCLGANNIQVFNVKLTGQNTSSDYTLVQFDLTWDNSWRTNNLKDVAELYMNFF